MPEISNKPETSKTIKKKKKQDIELGNVKELPKLKSNYELRLSFIADSFIFIEFIHQS